MQGLPELPPSPRKPPRGVWLSGRQHFLPRDTPDPTTILAGPWGRAAVPAGDRHEGSLSGATLGRLLSHFNPEFVWSRKSNSAVRAWYIPKNASSFWNRGSTQARGGDPVGQPPRRAVPQAGGWGLWPPRGAGLSRHLHLQLSSVPLCSLLPPPVLSLAWSPGFLPQVVQLSACSGLARLLGSCLAGSGPVTPAARFCAQS